ncbi:SAM hydrolase/SAM-dependent halogenase family protein, partial [Salinimicrobium oceani]
FPEGSIHIIGVDSELTPENKHIALKLDGHYFICANNGILSLIASEYVPEKIVEINIHDKVQSNFPVLDVFVKVAGHLARGGTLEVIGKIIPEVKQLKEMEPLINSDQNQIKGNV